MDRTFVAALVAVVLSCITIGSLVGGAVVYNSMNLAYREAMFDKIKYGR